MWVEEGELCIPGGPGKAAGNEKNNSGHSEIHKGGVWWTITLLWDLTRAEGIRGKMGLKS